MTMASLKNGLGVAMFPMSPIERFHWRMVAVHWRDAKRGRAFRWLHLRRAMVHALQALFTGVTHV